MQQNYQFHVPFMVPVGLDFDPLGLSVSRFQGDSLPSNLGSWSRLGKVIGFQFVLLFLVPRQQGNDFQALRQPGLSQKLSRLAHLVETTIVLAVFFFFFKDLMYLFI